MEREPAASLENERKAEVDMRESAYIRPVDTTGLVFMSILAMILLFSLLKSERRYRNLLEQMSGRTRT